LRDSTDVWYCTSSRRYASGRAEAKMDEGPGTPCE